MIFDILTNRLAYFPLPNTKQLLKFGIIIPQSPINQFDRTAN